MNVYCVCHADIDPHTGISSPNTWSQHVGEAAPGLEVNTEVM